MRSHVTLKSAKGFPVQWTFQYRKQYEVTCDLNEKGKRAKNSMFQYRKRYEVTCDMDSPILTEHNILMFQYRKRYEVTCDPTLD